MSIKKRLQEKLQENLENIDLKKHKINLSRINELMGRVNEIQSGAGRGESAAENAYQKAYEAYQTIYDTWKEAYEIESAIFAMADELNEIGIEWPTELMDVKDELNNAYIGIEDAEYIMRSLSDLGSRHGDGDHGGA